MAPIFGGREKKAAVAAQNESWSAFATASELSFAAGTSKRPPKISGWYRGAPLSIWGEVTSEKARLTMGHLALELPPGLEFKIAPPPDGDDHIALPPTGDSSFDSTYSVSASNTESAENLHSHVGAIMTRDVRAQLLEVVGASNGDDGVTFSVSRDGVRVRREGIVSTADDLRGLALALWHLADVVTDLVHKAR